MSLVLSILPLVLVVAAGYLLLQSGLIGKADWIGIENLCFRALIPAVLIVAIARSDLSLERFGGFILALLLTLGLLTAFALCLRFLSHERLDNPSFTTLYQTSVRWNAFVALAAAEQFISGNLAILAVAIAVCIPVINIACILVLAMFGPSRATPRIIALTVAQNPLVQACVIGLGLNLLQIDLPGPLVEALDMIGRAALGVGLMAVGAGISFSRLGRFDWKVIVAAVLRPIISPVIFVAIAWMLDLNALQTIAGVLVFSAPAASNGYIVAKKMGGNAELYADVLTWQTLLSLVVLPIWAALLL